MSLYSEDQVEQVKACLGGWGQGPLWGLGPGPSTGGPGSCTEALQPPPCEQNDRQTQLKTLPSRKLVDGQ